MIIRPESPNDVIGIYQINVSAFETEAEAGLVNTLREAIPSFISLVAEDSGEIIGHILFSPVILTGHPDLKLAGLAPMAVIPPKQNSGIGSALVRAGIAKCKELGYDAVAVLGHPNYYPRFGFLPSVLFGIRSEYDVPDEVFMILELEKGVLAANEGIIKFHPAFADL